MPSIIRHLALCVLLTASEAEAQSPQARWQNLDAMDAIVAAAVGGEGMARPVDRRLKLAICPAALTVGAPVGGAVSVACASLGWRVRVPVIASAGKVIGPILMRRGDPVSVVTGSPGFSATVSGIADGEGRLGDRVRIRTGPATSVVGLIADAGTVRIY